jgi:hypothetical protein
MFKNKTQVGCIKFGGGINARNWIAAAKAQGYAVLICGDYAELYR